MTKSGGKNNDTAVIVASEAQFWRMAGAPRGFADAANGGSGRQQRFEASFRPADPLLGLIDLSGERLQEDNHGRWSVPSNGTATFARVHSSVNYLTRAGLVGFVLANRLMSVNQSSRRETACAQEATHG
ncbi:MAG: hypothetical protein N2111_14160 [Candidatus Sumerlaeaceae bacterium]|nr:hypothetical protein [Candidatus Sumerlaeaceae bacterium]